MSAFRRAFKENSAINSGERFRVGADPYTLELQSAKADMFYKARLKRLQRTKKVQLLSMQHGLNSRLQRFAFNPYINYGPRFYKHWMKDSR